LRSIKTAVLAAEPASALLSGCKDNNPVYFLTGKLSTFLMVNGGTLSTYIMRAQQN